MRDNRPETPEEALAGERRHRRLVAEVQRETPTSWPQAIAQARNLTDAQLERKADGCTELTCLYHGAINTVRREREASA